MEELKRAEFGSGELIDWTCYYDTGLEIKGSPPICVLRLI
jgi:hypothetical protein